MALITLRRMLQGISSDVIAIEARITQSIGRILFTRHELAPVGCSIDDEKDISQREGFLLMAVPKRKTTPSKKKLRHQHKWLKNRTDIEVCAVCGNHKLLGHLCGQCLEKVNVDTREYRKNKNPDDSHWPIPEVLKKFRLY
ncbi:predicted protein [Nematostella vectensis]|uniref:Large ribosomal subunit protein bL32m n=1 Tax=Nematostella vectensis TaxID=45351 RepID=A7RHL7_NEMVE|nr:predicted protein [Nematostella vectensis]|eukprot:XP_001640938.1 predicted protein [Nematostella vectensis]